jgi:hypothetical protein
MLLRRNCRKCSGHGGEQTIPGILAKKFERTSGFNSLCSVVEDGTAVLVSKSVLRRSDRKDHWVTSRSSSSMLPTRHHGCRKSKLRPAPCFPDGVPPYCTVKRRMGRSYASHAEGALNVLECHGRWLNVISYLIDLGEKQTNHSINCTDVLKNRTQRMISASETTDHRPQAHTKTLPPDRG